LQLPENKALSWGIIGKSAPIRAEITIRKSQDIALVYALGTFLFGNPLPNILENPGVFFDVLSRKHAFPCNLGLPNPYPYFHGSASSLHSLYPLSPPRNSQYEEMYQGRQEAVGGGDGLRLTKNSFKFQNPLVLKQAYQFSPKLVMEDFLLLGRDSVLPAYEGAKAPLCNPPLLYTSCPCAVPIIPLPGITLSDSAYRPFPPVDNYLLSA
jgi:hypothetical protein